MILGYVDEEINNFLCQSLVAISEDGDIDKFLLLVLKFGEINLKAMELLYKANTEFYGVPSPKEVSLKIEKGPFIVITGLDLKDLHLLLEQTKDKGINIYTHGEMLPAHAQN